jgi:hypothetical protein
MSPVLKKRSDMISTAGSTNRFDLLASFDNSKYKVSILDMVNSAKKTSSEEFGQHAFGEPTVPHWDAKLDKPLSYRCSPDKKHRDFISQYTKQHRLDPGPKYEVHLDMTKKHPTKENAPRTIVKRDKIPTRIE